MVARTVLASQGDQMDFKPLIGKGPDITPLYPSSCSQPSQPDDSSESGSEEHDYSGEQPSIERGRSFFGTGWKLADKLLNLGEPDFFKKQRKKANNDAKTLKAQFDKAMTKLQELGGNDESWQEFVDILEELAKTWNNISVEEFVINLRVLGPSAREYLDHLSINLDQCEVWRSQQDAILNLAYFQGITVAQGFPTDKNELLLIADNEHDNWCCRLARCRGYNVYTGHKAMHSSLKSVIHWTTVKKLIDPENIDDRIFIIKVLQQCDSNDVDCFSSAASRCIVERCWIRALRGYILAVVFDVMFLLILGLNTAWIMYSPDHQAPPDLAFIILMAFAARAAVTPLVDWIMACCQFGVQLALFAMPDFYIFTGDGANLLVGGFLLCFGSAHEFWHPDIKCPIVDDDLEENGPNCAFLKHPVVYMAAIALAWWHLILELMCIPFLGKTVVPAFYAIISVDSIKFSTFLCLLMAGSFQAYWSLPIEANQPQLNLSHLQYTFMKIFKLDLLGDFDVRDLEGVDDKISMRGEISEGEESQLYHDGIQAMCIFSSSVIAVAAINLSIGVLSRAYEENKARATNLYYHFLSGYIYKLLLREKNTMFLKWLFCKCICFCFHQKGDDHHQKGEQNAETDTGYFIRCDKPNEEKFLTQKDLSDFRQEIKKFESLLQGMNKGGLRH